ncbi:MAG: Bor family protein [candidate division KSB1 bacterium]
MKKTFSILPLAFALLLFVSCYHARIETGLPPSSQVVEKTFAASWIYGLVPPNTLAVAKDCGKGVAIVETELSFVNQLVGALTLGIYTPMHIKVTCASSTTMGALDSNEENLIVANSASEQEVLNAFALAADKAVASKQRVYVSFK